MFRQNSPKESSLPAILFDLDGTLVDSVPDIEAAVNAILAEDGRPRLDRDAVVSMVGNGARVLMQRVYTATGPANGGAPDDATLDRLFERFLDHYGRDPSGLTTIFPGVIETLTTLQARGYPMAVVTNKPEKPALDLLDKLDLRRFFPVVVGGGTTPALKPDPQPLVHALTELVSSDHPAVMVGDSLNDSAAARAAGIPCVCVTFGYRHGPLESLGADALIDHFSELPQAVDRLFALA